MVTIEDLEEARDKWDKSKRSAISAKTLYHQLKAREKAFKSRLYLETEGSSIEERKARVETSEEWAMYLTGLLEAQERAEKFDHVAEDYRLRWQQIYFQLKQQSQDQIKTRVV